jgi:predicted regulator of Ras-like GTPase activity (Roadblock/LC7/MglB family)
VSEPSSSGSISRLQWSGAELLLQTEIRRSPEPVATTLMLSKGEVLCRGEGEWVDLALDQVAEQRRLRGYHGRLLRALRKLRDEKDVGLDQLREIFQRLVRVALGIMASPASEILAVLPGARWAALVGAGGEAIDSAPPGNPAESWSQSALRFLGLADRMSGLFGGGQVSDVSLRAAKGYVLITRRWGSALVVEVEQDRLGPARFELRRLQEREL